MTMKIIDMHSHWGTPRGLGTDLFTEVELKGQALAWNGELKTVTEAEMAQQFRKSGVRAILDLGFRFGQPPELMSSLYDYAIDTQKQYSDVILGNWLHIDPRRSDAVQELRRCIDRKGDGFVGLGVSGAGLNIAASDPVYEPLYALCEEAGIPVLILVGTTALGVGVPGGGGVQIEFSHPRHLDQVAATHPGLSILAGRPGWPWQTETIAVLLHKRNVYYEVHGWSPKYFTEDLKREISRRLKGRILFGADYPMLTHERLVSEWQNEGYASDVLDGVFHGNAETFLGGLKGYQFKHME
ncbi:MAG: amidohydrolase [Comamonadaceae bacterium]|nr:MAG: amidohydrolase [Comamonadaceae bacterium]